LGEAFSIPLNEQEQTDITASLFNALAALENHTHNGTGRGALVAGGGVAAAGSLTGATLAANVLASSLTSVGVLAAPHMTSPVVDSGGITATGASTITGTLGGVTTLTCTTVTATNLDGTLSTAAQANVTSVGTLTALTVGGDLTVTGTARRILGDFSNATVLSRVLFQSSTVNGNTQIGAIPNGSGTASTVFLYTTTDPTNAASLRLAATTTGTVIDSLLFLRQTALSA